MCCTNSRGSAWWADGLTDGSIHKVVTKSQQESIKRIKGCMCIYIYVYVRISLYINVPQGWSNIIKYQQQEKPKGLVLSFNHSNNVCWPSHMRHGKTPLAFHYTGCLIGLLIMVYCSQHSPIYHKQPGFFIAHMVTRLYLVCTSLWLFASRKVAGSFLEHLQLKAASESKVCLATAKGKRRWDFAWLHVKPNLLSVACMLK